MPTQCIIYPFIEGEKCDEVNSELISDISKQLDFIHKCDIIHADIRLDNIIKRVDGKYTLIDYGCSFSADHKKFPPLNFMEEFKDSEPIKTKDNDIDALNKLS